MQLIETYASTSGQAIWIKFNNRILLRRQQNYLRLTGSSSSTFNAWINQELVKKSMGKTWGELCN